MWVHFHRRVRAGCGRGRVRAAHTCVVRRARRAAAGRAHKHAWRWIDAYAQVDLLPQQNRGAYAVVGRVAVWRRRESGGAPLCGAAGRGELRAAGGGEPRAACRARERCRRQPRLQLRRPPPDRFAVVVVCGEGWQAFTRGAMRCFEAEGWFNVYEGDCGCPVWGGVPSPMEGRGMPLCGSVS